MRLTIQVNSGCACGCDFSYRRGRSRLAAHLQMGGAYWRLADPDVGKCGRHCHGSVSCL